MAELAQKYHNSDMDPHEDAMNLSDISELGLSEAIKKLLGSDDSFDCKKPDIELLSLKNKLFKKQNEILHSIDILKKELSRVEKEIIELTELER